MKKIICVILMLAIILTSTSTVEARGHNRYDDDREDRDAWEGWDWEDWEDSWKKGYEYWFSMKDKQVIRYKKCVIPTKPIIEGMGAKVTFKASTGVLKVVKESIVIVIDFKKKSVSVNGVNDKKSDIFTSKERNRPIVVLKYIAKQFGLTIEQDDDDIIVRIPELSAPTNIIITLVGTTAKANTINGTTQYLTATAKITQGQATGGRAELYVGSKLVATDKSILATDKSVDFTTSDGSPTNDELKTVIPNGGIVTVKLYNASNHVIGSSKDNPTLTVDYIAPIIGGIYSANYDSTSSKLTIAVTGATANGDFVDVTKLILMDSVTGRTYQLTNTSKTGSTGSIVNSNQLVVNVGTTDRLGIAILGSNTLYLKIAAGSLLSDAAGNTSIAIGAPIMVPLTYQYILNAPTNVSVTPIGGNTVANTLNASTILMNASAKITPGQATGGRAELYVGTILVAYDTTIAALDDTVTFTTSDYSPTNAKLQTAIPVGGVVTVKLYSFDGKTATSTVGNPTLTVDYIPPTISSVTSAIYDKGNNVIYLNVTGASSAVDTFDVTKLTLYDTATYKSFQLTNAINTGSKATVNNSNTIIINLGSSDRNNLKGFQDTTLYLSISGGALIKDTAGNESVYYTATTQIPVSVIK